MLRLVEGLSRFSDFKFEISNLITQAVGISKQLHGWLNSLKDTEIKGVKYYTKKEKTKAADNKEFDEFDRQMAEFKEEFERKLSTGEINRNASTGESH